MLKLKYFREFSPIYYFDEIYKKLNNNFKSEIGLHLIYLYDLKNIYRII
jgi:hypothetical protein